MSLPKGDRAPARPRSYPCLSLWHKVYRFVKNWFFFLELLCLCDQSLELIRERGH
ncbi:hypothetical protein BH20ACT13_BH20ACT13_24330 [soil metagenome]